MLQIDQTSDLAKTELWRFSQQYSLPDYVKQASPAVLEPAPALDSLAFADVRHRQFPCNTKEATYLSHLYFLHNMHKLAAADRERVAGRLANYATRWNIQEDVGNLCEKYAQLKQPRPLDDDDFMLVRKVGEVVEREYPLRNLQEIREAGAWLLKHSYHFPFVERRQMARRLQEKAAAVNVTLPEDVEMYMDQQLGRGFASPDMVIEQIDRRLKLASKQEHQRPLNERLFKLASDLREHPRLLLCPTTSDRLCALLDTFDRVSGMTQHYGQGLATPEDTIFAVAAKEASAQLKELVTLTTGSVFPKTAFTKLSVAMLQDVFGHDFASQVSDGIGVNPDKLAELAATFPRGDADLLERLLAESGQRPTYKQAMAFKPLPTGTLRELAAVHAARA